MPVQFDKKRYLAIQQGAVNLAPALEQAVAAMHEAGISNIFFMGTGGAAILMHPAVQLLKQHGTLPVYAEITAELMASGSRQLGKGSLVVIPSLSGTTKESVAFMDYCKERGARTIALVGHAGTPVAEAADHTFVNFAEDDTSSESFYLQGLIIAMALLRCRGELPANVDPAEVLPRVPALLLKAKEHFAPAAEAQAKVMQGEPWHIITAAGNAWPEAWYFGMCILEEMQWIRTRPVHAADFFHGPLELVEKGVSVMLLKGEDAARPLADRVERFIRQYTDKVFVLDTAAFDMPGLSPEWRGLLSPMVLSATLQNLAEELAALRNHPLTTRRYYRKVAY